MKTSKVAGRIAVYVPDHPASNNRGYILRSRYRMEKKLGRRLNSNEEVHHKNEDHTDDSLGNLEVMSKSEHARHHDNLRGSRAREMDYGEIAKMMKQGLGCRKIAAKIGRSLTGVKLAMKTIRNGPVLAIDTELDGPFARGECR